MQLRAALDDEWVEDQRDKYVGLEHYDYVVRCSLDVYKPDGSPLLLFRRRALPQWVCRKARPALRRAGAMYNDHRGYYSNVIGYFGCRVSYFTRTQVEAWGSCLPLIRAADRVYKRELPELHEFQRKLVRGNELAIYGTAFTTVTVNLWDDQHDARTPLHTDAGNLKGGFGVLSVLSSGGYRGGYLCFPKYGVAVDMRTTDVLLADVSELHGNTEIRGKDFERICCVFYFHEGLLQCGH